MKVVITVVISYIKYRVVVSTVYCPDLNLYFRSCAVLVRFFLVCLQSFKEKRYHGVDR